MVKVADIYLTMREPTFEALMRRTMRLAAAIGDADRQIGKPGDPVADGFMAYLLSYRVLNVAIEEEEL